MSIVYLYCIIFPCFRIIEQQYINCIILIGVLIRVFPCAFFCVVAAVVGLLCRAGKWSDARACVDASAGRLR